MKTPSGKIQLYVGRQLLALEEQGEFAFLAEQDRAKRVYDSTLSKPGRICSTDYCREFVPGGVLQCAHCESLT